MRKYTSLILVGLVIPLVLSSCWKKNVQETATETVSSGSEVAPYTTEQYEAMFAAERAKPLLINSDDISTQDISSYIGGDSRNILALIESLTGSDSASVNKRAYLRSYMGDYSGALAERDALCKVDPRECPKYGITLDIGATVDQSGDTISSPNVYIDGKPLVVESSIVQPETYDNMVHRVRVEKEGYLDSYARINDTETSNKESITMAPVLAKSDTAIVMDNAIGGTYTAGAGTGSITYTIAPDTFTTTDNKKVTGNINLYLFALGKGDNDLSAFQLDVFSASGSNLGGSMVTEGMPFVTAYQDGKILKIAKPIEGVGQIHQSIFKMDFEGVPKNTWLREKELMKHGIPGYWRLNRESGVWIESEMQILDTDGHYKFLFM